MNLYFDNKYWKSFLYLMAIIIVFGSINYTNNLVSQLSKEESKRVELWADALKLLRETKNTNFILVSKILENNETIPIILTDGENNIIDYRNIDTPKKNIDKFLKNKLIEIQSKNKAIEISLVEGKNYIYYTESKLLERLAIYPYIQLSLIIFFLIIAYQAYSYSKKSEQNRLWVGMSKETAHQLGTPLSSLMAWLEILKINNVDQGIIDEMDKDVNRLMTVANRFSKIGSKPKIDEHNIKEIISSTMKYMSTRVSKNIKFHFIEDQKTESIIDINKELIQWVIENICKNAVDSMGGKGELIVNLCNKDGNIIIDLEDTGKGISKKNFKSIFKAGFTTKKRGWGLGLSLAKRIIENYHRGKISILWSEIGVGTCFRISLPIKKH